MTTFNTVDELLEHFGAGNRIDTTNRDEVTSALSVLTNEVTGLRRQMASLQGTVTNLQGQVSGSQRLAKSTS
jgi:hypothetical protein